jgi:hypothetical protein
LGSRAFELDFDFDFDERIGKLTWGSVEIEAGQGFAIEERKPATAGNGFTVGF